MKKNFTKAVLLALTVVSMGMFNSCKDHDDCNINGIELSNLEKQLEEQKEEIQNRIDELQDLIDAIKQCSCTPLTPEQVQQMIDDAIKNKVSANEFEALVLDILKNYDFGFTTEEEVIKLVNDAIAKYMAEHPATGDGTGLTEDQIQTMITAAVDKFATMDALNQTIATLTDALNKANARTDSLANAMNNQNTTSEERTEALENTVNELNIAATQAIAQLNTATTTLNTDVTALNTDVAALKEAVETLKAQLNDIITNWGPKVEEVVRTSAEALALAQSNYTQITTMQEQYEALVAKMDSLANLDHNHNAAYDDTELRNSIAALAEEMKNCASKQALRDVLTAAELMHAEAIECTKSVAKDVKVLQDRVDALYAQVQENREYIKGIFGYLKKLITNITIQAVKNPVFGSFAFPWGVQSNILVGYYGETDNNVHFPTVRTANYIYKEYALTEKDAEMLGASVESYEKYSQDILVEETEGNAGTVYLTINPTNVDFSGTKFSLVNSQDEESPVKLGALKASDEVLKFGFTRAANNGFYEATATFTEDNIPTLGVDEASIKSSLKAIAKEVIDNRQNMNIKEAAQNLYNVFMEVNGSLDANGIKAAWDYTDAGETKTQSVYSKYAIAATAIKPLSYEFLYDNLYGEKFENLLPTISPIDEAILNDIINLDDLNIQLNFDLSGLNFKIDPINVQIPAINIDFEEIKIDNIGELTAEVEIPVYKVDTTDTGEPVLVQTGVEMKKVNVDATSFKAAIEESINEALDKAGASLGKDIQKQLNDALETQLNQAVANIEGAVNDLIQNQLANEINGQLDAAIKDVMEQVKDQVTAGAGSYIEKANAYINKINNWSNKINNYGKKFFENINSKLQVTVLYEGNDGNLHQLSNNKKYPTVVNGEGVFDVFVTSYTGEIIAPAFKKFIGVTNVFKDGDSAQNGCTDCKAALDAVNGGEYFNKVFPGSRYGVAIENMKKGYTYEIFYSGLDYSGKISARKFYVTVK